MKLKHFLCSTFILLSLVGISTLVPIAGFQAESAYAQSAGTGAAAMDLDKHAKEMETQPDPEFGCMSGGEGGVFEGCLTAAAYYTMKGCAWIAVWTSVIFNYVVLELLVNMGKVVGNMPGITDAWEVVRDLTNVFLVFITVYIGISMIVGVSSFGSKQLLGRVILAALLVNFSSTVAKLVIDVSNVAAIHGYMLLLNQNEGSTTNKTVVTADQCAHPTADKYEPANNTCITTGIAGVFWSRLKMTQIFNIKDFQEKGSAAGATTKKGTDDALIWVGLLGSIMFLVLAFVMGAMAFMLIGRFLILVMCIIFSPLAFVALITGISGRGKEWWSMLTKQAIVAPVMFLMLWISYRMIDGLAARLGLGEGSKGNIANGGMADVGSMGILTYFLIIIGSLIMSLIVAQELGAKGANAAISYGKRASKAAAMGLTVGTGLWMKNKWDNSEWRSRRSDTKATRHAAAVARAHETKEDGTYADTSPRARLMRAKTRLGMSQRKSARLNEKADIYRKKEAGRKAYMDSVGKEAKYQETRRNAQIVDEHQGKDEAQLNEEANAMASNSPTDWGALEASESARIQARSPGVSVWYANERAKEYVKKLQDKREQLGIHNARTPAEAQAAAKKYVDQVKEARASMGKIGTEEMTRMRNENPEELAKVAEYLSGEQIKTMEDTATYGNKKHAQSNTRVKATRRDATERTFKPAGGAAIDMRAARKSVKRMSESEHKDFVKTIEDLARTLPTLTPGSTAHTKARDELRARISAMQPKDIVKLEDRTIMNVEVLPVLDSRHLRALDAEGKLEGPDRKLIYDYSQGITPHGAPVVTLDNNAKKFFNTDQGKMWS